jgi:hypothetical protein
VPRGDHVIGVEEAVRLHDESAALIRRLLVSGIPDAPHGGTLCRRTGAQTWIAMGSLLIGTHSQRNMCV